MSLPAPIHLPALRFGKPYESLERTKLVHFITGEPVAEVSQIGGAMLGRDMQKASRAREALLAIDPEEIVERLQTADCSESQRCSAAPASSLRLTKGKGRAASNSGSSRLSRYSTPHPTQVHLRPSKEQLTSSHSLCC